MPAGRPPKPHALHVLHGTRSSVRTFNHAQTDLAALLTTVPPPPPVQSSDIRRRKWRQTATALIDATVLKATDLDALESYCTAYELMCKAKKEIDREGIPSWARQA